MQLLSGRTESAVSRVLLALLLTSVFTLPSSASQSEPKSTNVGALARSQLQKNKGTTAVAAVKELEVVAKATPTAAKASPSAAKASAFGPKGHAAGSSATVRPKTLKHPLSKSKLHGLISDVARAISLCVPGQAAPAGMKRLLDKLGVAVAPSSYDESHLARSSAAIVALFCGGVILGKDKGAHYRSRARDLLTPPKRKLLFSGGSYVKILKAGDNRFREICLTFDDGPSPYSAKLLDVLARYKVPATFFIIGHRITRHPDILRRMVYEGHIIANHSWRHDRQPRLSSRTITNRLAWFDTHLAKALGEKYRCDYFRLPYNSGKNNERVNKTLAPHFKYVLDWSIDPRDWDYRQRKHIVKNVMDHARKRGAILLMHDNQKSSYLAAKVDHLVRTLLKSGFRFISLDELIGCDLGTKMRKQLVKAMKLVDDGDVRGAYRQAMLLARDHRDAREADEALFLASVLARLIEDKSDVIPQKVARYIRRRYLDSPFSSLYDGELKAKTE